MSSSVTHLQESAPAENNVDEISLCINCHKPVLDNFCGSCGQPKNIKRITFKALAGDVYERLFALDNKFTRTTWFLLKDPGFVIGEFIRGNRVKFFGAAGLYFLLLTIYLLLMSLFDISFQEMSKSVQEAVTNPNATPEQIAFGNKINNLIFNNMRIFGFLMIPFFSFALMILYRKSRLNFFEHTVAIFYAFSLGMVFNIVALFIYAFSGYNLLIFLTFFNILIFGYIISGYYHKRKVLGFFKGLAAYMLGYIFFMLAVLIASVIVILADPTIAGLPG